jgi:hypothetical protein
VDKTTLVSEDLETGKMLVTELDARGVPVDVAAWLQDGETGTWRLFLSSPIVESDGPRSIYQAVSDRLRALQIETVELDDVLVMGPRDNIARELKRLVRTGDEPQQIRLDDLDLASTFFKSARVYRVRGGHEPGHWLEYDARVRAKATGRLGTVRGVFETSSGRRYLVLFDLTSADLMPLDGTSLQPAGQDFAESELDFLYAVRPGGIAEKPPIVARPA